MSLPNVPSDELRRFARFVANGLVATAVHYSVLEFNVQVLQFQSVGLANFIAALFGISASFAGNRWFVFGSRAPRIGRQAASFVVLYGAIALLHGVAMHIWADRLALNYRLGFVLFTGAALVVSYAGNRFWVFR